ncbi:MAG: helix-turn-helix domain-containing protein [Actinomycetota bacterium]|nr:helix-turn-helix domain-containing protein [Actinomycetota bacterium]
MGKKKRRGRAEHTDDWDGLLALFAWPEQERYEQIHPLVLFGDPVAERAEEVGSSERTLHRRLKSFEAEGVESLFAAGPAKPRRLPPAIRRLIVDRKAEHPAFSLGEIARICYVAFGRRPSKHTVKHVLEEAPTPLMPVRRYEPYHEMPEGKKRREALVELHADGWTVKSIAGYMKTSETTVYRVLKRWAEEGAEGLEDRPHGRPPGVRKVDLQAMEAVRRLQENPGLGAFRVHAALEQMGLHLSRATCGRIMATNRRVYGLEKPTGTGSGAKKPMPFASSKRHEYWSADIRYVDHGLPTEGNVYVISVLENHSRAVLASSLTRAQDLPAFLSVLCRAVERYGSPEALVTDSGSVFRANRARAVYEALGIEKEEIERGKPWQNYAETTFNIQRRMADWHFARALNWADLLAAHERWVADYNEQEHWAHLGRADGRRSPSEVLGWLAGVRYLPEDLERAFFSSRFTRTLDSSGYARFRNWRVMGHEALARKEAALWLQAESLTLEYRGQPLSRYEVEFVAGTEELRAIGKPRLFETSYDELTQLRLFALDTLGQGGWLKALKLDGYAPRRPRRPQALQQVLFPYLDAI